MAEKILIVGGAGYIGSHVAMVLAKSGYEPVTLDNLVYGHQRAVRFGPFEAGDMSDRARLDEVFRTHKPSAVMHFAAYTYVGESVNNPGKYYRNNCAGTLCLLEAMRDHGCARLVFSSSCAVYGLPERLPLTEDHPLRAMNPYGWSKLMCEQMMTDFGLAHGLSTVSLRYFNAVGACPEEGLGEDHSPETHLVPLAVEAALSRRPPLKIFGRNYPTPDGTAVRDYVHVLDLAQAHALALGRMAATPPGDFEAFNLGTGSGHSVAEVVRTVREVSGRDVPCEDAARRPGDPPVLVASSERARTVLGWRPEHLDLAGVIDSAWRWHGR